MVKKGNVKYAKLGDVITCVVKEAEPRKEVKKHAIVKVLIVRQKKPFKRKDGSYIRFQENAGIVLKGAKDMMGNRVFGPIPREIKELGFEKIANLAPELV
jgi:large subunit ribosomal protein L14